jgi:phosphoglycolate phosphatase
MKMMKAVIFDLDGTLLDTLDDIADSMNKMLEKFGLPTHNVEDYKYFVGDGATALAERCAPNIHTANITASQLASEYKAEYSNMQANKTVPYDGIPELLSALTERGVKIAVLTNKAHPAALDVMSLFFPTMHFDAIIGHRPGHPLKPDPAGVYEILDTLKLQHDEVLYVGDTNTDMQTAAAAGLKSVGVLWGFRSEEELVDSGADIIVSHPLEILQHI